MDEEHNSVEFLKHMADWLGQIIELPCAYPGGRAENLWGVNLNLAVMLQTIRRDCMDHIATMEGTCTAKYGQLTES